jgi:threonine synthase
LVCTQCGSSFDLWEEGVACRECGSLLDAKYDLQGVGHSLSPDTLAQRDHSVWRYRELLPVQQTENIVTLGEGWTPIIRSGAYAEVFGFQNLYLKLDYLNPTGSFKDRGSAVLISKAKELGVESVVDDSSGNAGSSIAAYCAKAGMTCSIFVPAGVPSGKTVQMGMYGASIVRVGGPRDSVVKAAQRACEMEGAHYVRHGSNAYFFEGNKTVAHEIAEQMGWSVPDHVVLPVGGGTLLVAVRKGFAELLELGLTGRVPRLHCVQSAACMPIVDAYKRGLDHVESVTEEETAAGGVRIGNPARGRQVLEAIRSSGGTALVVSDEELLFHHRALAERDGIFAEPTSCVPLAGLSKLYESGHIARTDTVVVPLTGFGLKDAETAVSQIGPLGESAG